MKAHLHACIPPVSQHSRAQTDSDNTQQKAPLNDQSATQCIGRSTLTIELVKRYTPPPPPPAIKPGAQCLHVWQSSKHVTLATQHNFNPHYGFKQNTNSTQAYMYMTLRLVINKQAQATCKCLSCTIFHFTFFCQ